MKNTAIITTVLLVLAIIAGGYFWKQNKSLDTTNKEMAVEISTLSGLRDDLVAEVDEMHIAYDKLTAANDSIAAAFVATDAIVKTQKAEIKKLKKDAANNTAGLTTEIEQLRTMKKQLSAQIVQLQEENSNLKVNNAQLVSLRAKTDAQNKQLAFEVSELKDVNLALQKELGQYVAASSRAANFRVDIRKNNDKPTGSSRRAREIDISFDLKNVPANKMGEHRLFLVIKDAKGNPFPVKNPIITRITPNNGAQPLEVIAQQSLRTNVNNNVRINFKQPVEERLNPGYYRASVYADWGLLGSAEFQLR